MRVNVSTNPELNTDPKLAFVLSEQDKMMLYLIAIYVVSIALLLSIPVVKKIMYPFKLMLTSLHEFGHASVGWLTGAKIHSIKVDADTGGVTEMSGGVLWLTLPAGYLGTAFWGGLLIFASFNLIGAKVGAIILGLAFLLTLIVSKNAISRIVSIGMILLIPCLWYFVELYLQYFVLFLGVFFALQSLWDFKFLVMTVHPDSDATKFSQVCGFPPQFWGFLWLLIGLIIMSGFTLLGIVLFK